MSISFTITPFHLKGMLQHIFDWLYITDSTSDTADRIFMNAMGIRHLFFIIPVCLNLYLIGLMGALYLLEVWAIVGQDIFTDALF